MYVNQYTVSALSTHSVVRVVQPVDGWLYAASGSFLTCFFFKKIVLLVLYWLDSLELEIFSHCTQNVFTLVVANYNTRLQMNVHHNLPS